MLITMFVVFGGLAAVVIAIVAGLLRMVDVGQESAKIPTKSRTRHDESIRMITSSERITEADIELVDAADRARLDAPDDDWRDELALCRGGREKFSGVSGVVH
jgi:hypothetical protein